MSIKVLVVDDSSFYRKRICDFIRSDPQLRVVGMAVDGEEAVSKARLLKPDVITMDIEMPVLDGIGAVRRIMADSPVPILMFSSLSYEGAKATLQALEAGAADFLPKKFENMSLREAGSILCDRIKAIARRRVVSTPGHPLKTAPRAGPYELIVIGTSTGGPVALQRILSRLPGDFPTPIVLVQHMPPTFTKALAERLDQQCNIRVKEAEQGDILKPGWAYLAPGGRQLEVLGYGETKHISIRDGGSEMFKPSVDTAYQSVAKYTRGNVLAIILTGMGNDGCRGAGELKKKGATIWAQDEKSCVVYGMPMAVVRAGLADSVMSLNDIGTQLSRKV